MHLTRLTFIRISRREELPAVSMVNSLTEQFATWSSAVNDDPGTHASIPPFMRDYHSPVRDPLSSQISDSKIDSDMET